MTILLVLLSLSWAFLWVALVCEAVTRRLRQPSDGPDTSRGTGPR